MILWNQKEIKNAKLVIFLQYKIADKDTTSRPAILRPAKMEKKDRDILTKLIDKYGKAR